MEKWLLGKMKFVAIVFVFATISCKQHAINIKTYKLTQHDIADIGPCFYFDSKDSTKDGFLAFGDVNSCVFITINNVRNILLPDDNMVLRDSGYLSVVPYKNKDYTIVLKLNRAEGTKRRFLNGIMIVKNMNGDSIVKDIEGRF